ncbi:MAG TPA: preprotein translocase subunit SecE [bacterium]
MTIAFGEWIKKSLQFLRNVKGELMNVSWPTKKETSASTLVVVVLVFITALFLWLIDIMLMGIISLFSP